MSLKKLTEFDNPAETESAVLELATPLYEIWSADDGIIIFRWAAGVAVNLALAQEAIEQTSRITGGEAHLLLVDISAVKSINREARKFFTSAQGPRAVALVGATPVARVIGNIFLGLDRNPFMPVQMFANEKDATLWLKKFKE